MAQPHCIGIILDGNRRWAKERGLSSLEGHTKGFEVLKDAARWVRDRGIGHFVVFAFSTENWNRSEAEVSYLMDIFRKVIQETAEELGREHIAVRFVGQRERFAADIQDGIRSVEERNPERPRMTLWVCLSYGGRAEIAAAAQAAHLSGEAVITEAVLAHHLWTAGMPDPDIVVRTGGEQRLSGFLPWQAVYSELFFIPQKWPDFTETILDDILREYDERERRFGA